MKIQYQRPRRLRANQSIRQLTQENHISASDFIVPLFICEGTGVRHEISAMPGYDRTSLDETLVDCAEIVKKGFRAVLLFVKVDDSQKDNTGRSALDPDGLMPKSIRAIKEAYPKLLVFTDVALDPYSSYGHDGIVENGEVVNDPTVEALAKMALVHAQAGADFVAPSDMMDGRIRAIRETLESEKFHRTGIMSYSAKYASCFYGPFRTALDSAPGFGDKKSYQMNPANDRSAEREIILDIEEGADIIMVKPALPYLDIVRNSKEITNIPIAAYQVSGEYAMIHAAARSGYIDLDDAIMESLICIKRAGADLIASYFWRDFYRITNTTEE